MHPRRIVAVNAVLMNAAGAFGVQIAVGDKRSVERHSQLAAVRVAGKDEWVPEAVPAVEHPQVRGVRDSDGQISGGVRWHIVENVVAKVRIVDAHEGKVAAVDSQRVMTIG